MHTPFSATPAGPASPTVSTAPAADAVSAHKPSHSVGAVLFDLDGTLIDSAPDLAEAADMMRRERGLCGFDPARYRPMAGAGARGMLGIAFGIKPSSPMFASLREVFFKNYEAILTQRTHAFAGVDAMLGALDARAMPWGVVTNKSERFALPLAGHMAVLKNSRTMVGGDTTPHAKPHPAPLLEAARRLGVSPQTCIYVGDDERDIAAGRAAGMFTLACTWGYLGRDSDVSHWGANAQIDQPAQLLSFLTETG